MGNSEGRDDARKQEMTVTEKFGVFDVLKLANERGEIGYAWGGDNAHLPFIREAEARGWIRWAYDATPGFGSKFEGRKRDVYLLTEAGRNALSGNA